MQTLSPADRNARIFALAAAQAGVDVETITPQTHFVNDLHYDSLAKVEFVIDLEEAFDVSIPDTIAEHATTVGEAVEMMERLLAGDTTGPQS